MWSHWPDVSLPQLITEVAKDVVVSKLQQDVMSSILALSGQVLTYQRVTALASVIHVVNRWLTGLSIVLYLSLLGTT